MPKVFWALLLERSIGEIGVQAALDVAVHAGRLGYHRLTIPYCRTDIARNELVKGFLKNATDPRDTLVMLDNDHIHPHDVIERLVAHDKPVVGALAFRRGEPYFPCAFVRDENGALRIMQEYPKGLLEVALTGTGAIAIQRQVFDALDEAGYRWPYFRYIYKAGDPVLPSEDIYFGECCESAGISHWLDTTLISPHITSALVDEDSWKIWNEDHPENKSDDTRLLQMLAPREQEVRP
jgi:hypothetical protein